PGRCASRRLVTQVPAARPQQVCVVAASSRLLPVPEGEPRGIAATLTVAPLDRKNRPLGWFFGSSMARPVRTGDTTIFSQKAACIELSGKPWKSSARRDALEAKHIRRMYGIACCLGLGCMLGDQ